MFVLLSYQRFFRFLEKKSTEPDSEVPPLDPSLREITDPDPELLSQNKPTLDQFRSLFELKEHPKVYIQCIPDIFLSISFSSFFFLLLSIFLSVWVSLYLSCPIYLWVYFLGHCRPNDLYVRLTISLSLCFYLFDRLSLCSPLPSLSVSLSL